MPTQANGYKGSDLLLKLGASLGTSTASYTTVAGGRTNSLSINNDMIDVTSKDNIPWRTLIEGGVQSFSTSISGVFNSDQSLADMMTLSMGGFIRNFQIVTGLGDTFTGKFKISKCERSGEYKGEETYTISLESSGAIAYVRGNN